MTEVCMHSAATVYIYIYIYINLLLLLLLFMWQQLVTGAAQSGAGLLATGMVQRTSSMKVLEWHKCTRITDYEGVEWHIYTWGSASCGI